MEEVPYRMVENAAFFWELHWQALSSTDYNDIDLVELEEKLDIQLEGLLEFKDEGWKFCVEALKFDGAGELFVAAYMAFSTNQRARIIVVIEKAISCPNIVDGLLSALAWFQFDDIKEWVSVFLRSPKPELIAWGVISCGAYGKTSGPALQRLLESNALAESPILLCKILQLAGKMNRKDLLPSIAQYQDIDDSQVVFWSIWASLILGNKSVAYSLKPYVFSDSALSSFALNTALRALPIAVARVWLRELVKESSDIRKVIDGAGVLGDAGSLQWLISQMKVPEHARLAAATFCLITGLDIVQDGFEADPLPDKVELELEELELEEDAIDGEDLDIDLPWPNALKLEQWWAVNRDRFHLDKRYFMGRSKSDADAVQVCRDVVATGYQHQKQAGMLELSLVHGDVPQVEPLRRVRLHYEEVG